MSARHLPLLSAVVVLSGLSACDSAPVPPVAATPGPSQVIPPPSNPASTSPASTAPASSGPASGGSVGSKPAGGQARYPVCPSAKDLEKRVDLPEDWHFVPAKVKCWKTWATASVEGPHTGDGVYLFHYRGGGWRYHSQGSGFDCRPLGIHEPAPFCDYS